MFHSVCVCVSVHYLGMIRPQDNPSAEAVSQIYGGRAATEADDVREGGSERHNQDLGGKTEKGRKRFLFLQERERYGKSVESDVLGVLRCISERS